MQKPLFIIRSTLFVALLGLTLKVFGSAELNALYLSFDQRLILTMSLELQNLGPKEAEKKVLELVTLWNQRKTRQIEVSTFSEFLQVWKGNWPESHSVHRDLEVLFSNGLPDFFAVTSKNFQLQKQIDQWIKEQPKKVVRALETFGVKQGQIAQILLAFPQALQLSQGLGAATSQIPMAEIQAMGKNFIHLQFENFDKLATDVSTTAFVGQKDKGLQIAFKTLLSGYYGKLGIQSKQQIVSAFLGSDLNSDPLSRFETLVQNSGPQLQKILQIIARLGNLDANLSKIFRRLESNVKRVPFFELRDLLVKEKLYTKFVSVEESPLGVGTMAQTHRAVLPGPQGNQHVVIRFLKPKIAERVEEDHRILSSVAAELDINPAFRDAGMPKISPLVEDITNTVRAELKMTDTVQNQKNAQLAYDNHQNLFRGESDKYHVTFKVPQVIFIGNDESKIMIQEQVRGQKYEAAAASFGSDKIGFKKSFTEALAKLWVTEIFFGNGAYHADLHPGNFLIDKNENQVLISLLDYGMAGKVTPQLRALILKLGAATLLEKPVDIAKALYNLTETKYNESDLKQFSELVQKQIDMKNLEPNKKRLEFRFWVGFAIDHGLKLPYDFVNLNRGIVILEKLLEEAGSPLNITRLSMKLGRRHPLKFHFLLNRAQISKYDQIKLGIVGLGHWGPIEKFREKIKSGPVLKVSPVRLCETLLN